MYTNKYEVDDIVKIGSTKPSLRKVNGYLGVIGGMSQSEEDKSKFGYAVTVLDSAGSVLDVWSIDEEDLQPTGNKANPEEFMSNTFIKVKVDPETGEGRIVEIFEKV